jgi:hypothetical protein
MTVRQVELGTTTREVTGYSGSVLNYNRFPQFFDVYQIKVKPVTFKYGWSGILT